MERLRYALYLRCKSKTGTRSDDGCTRAIYTRGFLPLLIYPCTSAELYRTSSSLPCKFLIWNVFNNVGLPGALLSRATSASCSSLISILQLYFHQLYCIWLEMLVLQHCNRAPYLVRCLISVKLCAISTLQIQAYQRPDSCKSRMLRLTEPLE